ncbi:ATP-binding cassette domain-containing protein [Phytohalomonas tamaricis]|uniref:ATP-binding cassette domain-containing protein n=1 Tax=Phytohalomonas tamaricis TaxID=2081032 RepID=UPI000D0BB629|nr:ATP-binding cassette domain-containing protein [Phytohalomonas tamaricis]
MTVRTLKLKDLSLTARDGIPLVRGVDLTVTAGRVTALVGASGSGKSLTCLALQGMVPSGVVRHGGRVLLDSHCVEATALRGRQLATVMQAPRSAFNPLLTMADHARETLAVRGIKAGEAQAQIDAVLVEVGLSRDVLTRYAFQLSGGMLQRMMIALALLSEAPFLIADEPTTDLDLVLQSRILALIEHLTHERGLGVLFVTHDMGVVARIADDVAVMHAGQIVERGTVHALFDAPQSVPGQALVAAHLSLYEEPTVDTPHYASESCV